LGHIHTEQPLSVLERTRVMSDGVRAPPKKGTKGTSKKGAKGKKGKGAAESEETHRCFHCQTESTKMMCCSQCHRAWYCGKPCQKKHWKLHKRACTAAVAAEARRATRRRKATEARGGGGIDKETCVICVGPVVAPVELPCGHAYCGACLAELRTKKVAQACPLCRAELPPGLDGLYDLACRAYCRILGMVKRGEASWASLPAAEQEEMEEAIAMLTEAGAQGHARAHTNLGILLMTVRKDFDGAEAAYRAAIAADPGDAKAHYNLGILLEDMRQDFDGAEAAYRAAIAADPGDACAHYNLGLLLKDVRKDFDGAEAAYRAAIAVDPGYAQAHNILGNLLQNVRQDFDGAEAAYRAAIAADTGHAKAHVHSNLGVLFAKHAEKSVESGGDLSDIAALWAQSVEHFTNAVSLGDDDRMLNTAKERLARVKKAVADGP